VLFEANRLAFERIGATGPAGERDEFHLGAIVQSLKTLANHMASDPNH
jgi:hypothetical protein